jgi:cell division protein FtsI (penicillin-binding protein 3)
MTSNKAIYWKANLLEKGKVPDVKGMSLRDAIYLIENFGYRVRTSGRGRVTSQNPKPNSQMAEGGVIMVTLG